MKDSDVRSTTAPILDPAEVYLFLGMEPPHGKPGVRNTDDSSHTFGMGVKLLVPKQATNKGGCLVPADVKTNQAVSRVT